MIFFKGTQIKKVFEKIFEEQIVYFIVTKLLLEFFFNLLYQTWSLTHFGQEI